MKWFTGTIPDAIGKAKVTDAIFVVYVHDSSEASKSTDETLADESLSSVLSSNKFVAIKLENKSESAKQFAQIYPVVVLPSLYFISGSTGIPMEILGGPLTKEKLKEKLDTFTKDATNTPAEAPSNNVAEQVNASNSEELEMMEEDAPIPCAAEGSEPGTSSSPVTENSIQVDTEDEPVMSVKAEEDKKEEENDAVPLEDRVARAKVLLAEKQAEKAEEKAENERKKEIERRKMGQEIAKRKREQYEEEIHSAVRERKKEKDEDKAARERVRAQIAADRLEREKRAAMLRGEAPAPSQEAPPNVVPPAGASGHSGASVARLKFRLPDGSSSIAQFPAETMLSEVRHHVEQQLVSSSSFVLSSTVHPKPFTKDDESSTLQGLGLVPSAIIVVLLSSRTSGPGSVVPSTGGIMQFLWLLLSPITFLLSIVRRLFSGGNTGERTTTPPTSSRDVGPSTSYTTSQRPTSSYGRPRERKWQRDGNIHRLQGSDDEDDNNTWNGNSTQQM